MKTITIDCAQCLAPTTSCDDCVVGVMLGAGPAPTLNGDEQVALAALASRELVPPLRLLIVDDAPRQRAA